LFSRSFFAALDNDMAITLEILNQTMGLSLIAKAASFITPPITMIPLFL